MSNSEEIFANLPNKFLIGLKWIKNNISDPPSPGKYALENGLFAIVDTYKPKPIRTSEYENHHKYIDIQVIVEGSEWIFWTKPKSFRNTSQYSEENDIEFFESKDPITESTCILMEPNMFAIFFPTDWHMPCIAPILEPRFAEKAEAVLKFVIKIPVNNE